MKRQASKGRGLLDDDDGEMQLTINENFAQQYERKKKFEEVSQAKETIRRLEVELSSDESDDEEEDEVGLLDPLAEDQFLRILPLLAKKDPKLYEKDITFFPPAPAADADASANGPAKVMSKTPTPQQDPKAKQPFLLKNYVKGAVLKPSEEEQSRARKREPGTSKEKPVLLKDFIRETLLKEGSEGLLESDEEDEGFKKPAPKELTHVEEQEMLKKQFLEAGEKLVAEDGDEDNADEEDGFLKLRSKSKSEREKEQKEDEEFWKAEEKRTGKKQGSGDDVLSSFWLGGDLDEKEKFLRNYILNNGWIDKEEGKIPTYEQILQEDEEDEEAIEQQEEFEMKHQEAVAFHYLEEGSDQIISHPRVIEDSARRKDSKRSKKRDKRKEKKAKERVQKEEELKRIKNLMKESIKKQLSKIQETSGAPDLGFAEDYLEDEFDPTEHDRKMASTFGDDYYEGEGDEEMPVFNEEPDENNNFGLQNTVGSLLGNKRIDEEEEEAYGGEEEYYGGEEEGQGQGQADTEAEEKKKMDQLLEKYYALDFEDLIAGEIPCRFKYRQVKPKSYGMDVATILSLPDAELNKRVSLKKLAPYRHHNLNAKKRAKRREKHGGNDGGHSRAPNRWSSSSGSGKRESWKHNDQEEQRGDKKRKWEEKGEKGKETEKEERKKKQKKESSGGSKIEKSKKEKKAKKQSRDE